MKIKIDEGSYIPEKAHGADAGYDLRTPTRVLLPAHGSACIDTGVHMAIPNGFFGKLESRSGLNVRQSIVSLGGVIGIVSLGGVIDSGYTGSIVAKLYNLGATDYVFQRGDKIVQLVIQPCENLSLEQVDKLEDTERGDCGFGSTGR